MNHIFFIDGPQMVGKTTLIKCLCHKYGYYSYKFPFGDYSKCLGFKSPEVLKGFQVGKDLATLYWLNRSTFDIGAKVYLIDRGPFSSIYYSLSTGRMTFDEVDTFLDLIKDYSGVTNYIFITSINSPKMDRSKEDGFDDLRSSEEDVDIVLASILDLAKSKGINLIHFENDFSKTPEENIIRLQELIIERLQAKGVTEW